MAGDHRCSVCQATFTRPQHVARHMRSHTGDRPYKCQFCGDQFARSDLLSRHVNKCHPNEKLPQLAGTRRKGSVAACRATTSKQSCDQCVQASLPCDGCNPCTTCVQKKCRCTFVKFHRQTAPVGPGHNPNLSPSTTYLHGEGYNISSLSSELYHQHVGLLRQGPSETHTASTAKYNAVLDAKYRTQADLVSRGSIPFHSASQLAPGQLYVEPQAPQTWGEWSQNPLDGFTVLDDARMSRNVMARYLLEDSVQASFPRQFVSAEDVNQFPKSNAYDTLFSTLAANGDHYQNLANSSRLGHPRRGSGDRSSDGSHTSSATSSSVHLPADMSSLSHQIPFQDPSRDLTSLPNQLNNPAITQSQNQSSQVNHRPLPLAAPEVFSSAFGLLSIDDPNVLAGLSNDGVPFFSEVGVNIFSNDAEATSVTIKDANQSSNMVGTHTMATPGTARELETRELREFWKAYVRTPFAGPASSDTPVFTHSQSQTPSGNGPRRARVSSLPSVKTPSAETVQPPFAPKENAVGNNVTSSIRTTLNGSGEDLRSYQAAVLARKTSFNLNPVPKKGRRDSSTSPQVPCALYGLADHDNPAVPPKIPNSGRAVSPVGNAFGKQERSGFRGPCVVERQNEDSHLLPWSVLDQEKLRPSFKRLPSQTLGPKFSKRRAQLSHGEEEEEDDEDGTRDFVENARNMAVNGGHTTDRRRMSDPAKG